MIQVLEFFRTLPKKRCKHCNRVIVEQAECYINVCMNCLKF